MPVSILLDYAPCFSAKSVARVKKKKKDCRKKNWYQRVAQKFESEVREDSIEHVWSNVRMRDPSDVYDKNTTFLLTSEFKS